MAFIPTAQQTKFASDLAILVGVVLKEVPDQSDVQAYVSLIKQEIDTVVAQPGSPTTKQIGDAVINVSTDIVSFVPDVTKGEKGFKTAFNAIVGFAKLFGL